MTKPESLSQKRRRAAYARIREEHEWKRDHPTRYESALSQAVERSGLKVIGYEYEVQDDEWHGWFNVAVEFRGKLCFIDFTANPSAKRDRKHMRRKEEFCAKYGHPLLIVKVGSVPEMQAQIELWKLTQRRDSKSF